MTMMEESIYALIPPAQGAPDRPRMHKSFFAGPLDEKTLVYPMGVPKRKDAHATLGLPNGMSAKDPRNFTRAHQGEPTLPSPGPPTQLKPKIKAPTPARTEKPIMNLKSGKNFITSNAVEVILSKPVPRPQELPFTMRPTFGKVPCYLQRNKKKIAAEHAQVEEYLQIREAKDSSSNVTQMSQDERRMLLGHLKTKWSAVNTAYQKISFTLDTPTKQKRKEVFEQQLAEIEKDIQLLERGDHVLVVND